MSHARVTSALPSHGPMATELGDPLPAPAPSAAPTPANGKPLARAKGAKGAKGAGAAATVAAPAAIVAAPAAIAGGPAAPTPAALESAAGPVPAVANEPQVRFGADHTGVMVTITQDLESDRIRQNWAAQGGQLPGYEANAGMMIMYKALPEMGAGANMTGVGINGGIRVSLLNLTPPKYETRDRHWTAFKIGGGLDLGAMGVTITTPVECYPYAGCVGGTQSASMTSFTLVGTVGVMRAFGSFDSPSDWSGWAIGAEWAPSWQSTTLTIGDGSAPPTTTSSFNATGFALSFERGSMKAMAMKMGKKARLKARLFLLPAVGDLPFLMTASIGAVWY